MKRFSSLFALGVHFFLHVLRMPWRRSGEGERRFRANYGPDGLFPLSADERRLLPGLDRCIACGLCNVLCEKLGSATRYRFGGPFALAAQARSMPDYPSFAAHLAHDDCGDCAACESVCPTGVPLRDLGSLVSRLARRQAG